MFTRTIEGIAPSAWGGKWKQLPTTVSKVHREIIAKSVFCFECSRDPRLFVGDFVAVSKLSDMFYPSVGRPRTK